MEKMERHGETDEDTNTPKYDETAWGYRHQQCLLLFCCFTTAYSMRACMGVALVAMVDSHTPHNISHSSHNSSLFTDKNYNVTNITSDASDDGILHALLLIPPYPRFQWDKKTQDMILSSFFWGYMCLQIPSGQLAHHFGAHRMLSCALLCNCVLSFCLPWASCYGGWALTMVLRVSQGLSQSCIVPCMHTLFGRWAPLGERGRLAGFAYGGQALGTVLGLPITGFLAASPLGWPGIFRFYGILSGLVGGIFWWLGANSPAKHRSISYEERLYIESNLGRQGKKSPPVPWKKILLHPGLQATVMAHVGHTWCSLILFTEVPAFMDKVLGVNIKANGLLTALPFMVMWIANFFFTWFSDMLIVKNILSVTHTRKLCNSIGSISAALGLIVLALVPKNIFVVETILVVIGAFKIACNVGFQVNHIDISSNFSGIMMSISNFVSNLVGSQAPLVAGFILTDVTSEYLWRYVFYLTAGIYLFTNTVFVLLGTSEKAEWDKIDDDDDKESIAMLKNKK